jgi:hypothetical protein
MNAYEACATMTFLVLRALAMTVLGFYMVCSIFEQINSPWFSPYMASATLTTIKEAFDCILECISKFPTFRAVVQRPLRITMAFHSREAVCLERMLTRAGLLTIGVTCKVVCWRGAAATWRSPPQQKLLIQLSQFSKTCEWRPQLLGGDI